MSKKKYVSDKQAALMEEGGREPCRLYLITPPRLEPRAFVDTLKAALDAGDVASLQLRLKSEDEMTAPADAFNSEQSLKWLDPGQTWQVSWGIRYTAPAK